MQLPKNLHVIGICGVAMSAIAIAFHKRGVSVTGSDKGFFPPVSTELEKQGIKFYAGWHPENMTHLNADDSIVIVGTASGSQNPETLYAKENSIPMFSYPEVLGRFFAKERSIICSGTWGKTSSAALLSYIFDRAGLDPSYMFGGVSNSHKASARLTDGKWSIFEGDEYKSSPTDPRAKFFHYKPTHLLLSAVSWDHADLYPTEKDYFNAFKKLLEIMPKSGFVIACKDNEGVSKILENYNGKITWYGRMSPSSNSALQSASIGHPFFGFKDVRQTKDGLDFSTEAPHLGLSWKIHSPMLGSYQAENITGCFAMAYEHGISPQAIIDAISHFNGLKRRMEKRLEGKKTGITVIDDIAHSPEKAVSVLNALRSIYAGKIIAVFEPNIGGRQRESMNKYDNAFSDADMVVIPRLTKLKISKEEKDQPMEGDELAQVISKTHADTRYIDDDSRLVKFLVENAKKGDTIAFLGSHGFRGMIEELVGRIK